MAVVGASHDAGSVGNDVAKNILEGGFEGEVFFVNPKGGELFGKNVSASIAEIARPVDLAVIITPAKVVPDVLRECGKRGVVAAIVISAGFRESGHGELEEEIVRIAEEYGIALLGPNCLGILVPGIALNASFAPLMPTSGSVAFLSQSGALCASVLDWAREYGMGFSAFVSTGNKAAVAERELLEYFLQDESTSAIAMYVEDLRETQELVTLLQTKNIRNKPVIVLKSGTTDEGRQASASHTGALAGSDEAYEALFRQAGIIRVRDTRELFLAIRTFSVFAGNESAVSRAAVVTNAGGPGVLATDALAEAGLALANLSEDAQETLRSKLPAAASVANPVDVLGDADAGRYEDALSVLLADNSTDAILVVLTPQTMTETVETAKVIASAKEKTKKPIVTAFLGAGLVRKGVETLRRGGVLTFGHPRDAVSSLSMLSRRGDGKPNGDVSDTHARDRGRFENEHEAELEDVRGRVSSYRGRGISEIGETKALPILEQFGFRTLRTEVASSAQEAREFAEFMGEKVVLKIVSPDILHKSDVGGVRVGVVAESIEEAYEGLLVDVAKRAPEANIEGVAVVEMAPESGSQMVLGMKRDGALGPVVMAGLGGIYVETIRDVAFGVLPLTKSDAMAMIRSLRTFPMLDGARGGRKLDIEAFAEAIVRMAELSRAVPEIVEIDINPLLVLPEGEGILALDGRMAFS